MSQLLLRLDQELELASDPDLVAELSARKAGALARLGRFQEAAATIKRIRELNAAWTHARAHVWIMLAEGIVNWHSDLSPQALDRINRAQVLSIAMRYDKAIALSSAWKAHIEFDMSNFDSMFRSLQLALKHVSSKDNEANARTAIVLCNLFSLCGNRDAAADWFMRGRRFALADGDQASVEALQYNRAVLAVTCLRAEHFEDQAGAEAVVAARREINSARNFQSLTKNEAGPNHLQLCEARLSSIEGKHDLALAGLEATILSVPFARGHFNESSVCLELAYCQFKLMQFDLALSSVSRVDFNSLVELEIDDRFVASCMLLEMSASDPRFGSPELLASQHRELREAYLKSRSDLSALVKKFCDESLGPLEAV